MLDCARGVQKLTSQPRQSIFGGGGGHAYLAQPSEEYGGAQAAVCEKVYTIRMYTYHSKHVKKISRHFSSLWRRMVPVDEIVLSKKKKTFYVARRRLSFDSIRTTRSRHCTTDCRSFAPSRSDAVLDARFSFRDMW